MAARRIWMAANTFDRVIVAMVGRGAEAAVRKIAAAEGCAKVFSKPLSQTMRETVREKMGFA